MKLLNYICIVKDAFEKNDNYFVAHDQIKGLLIEMAKDKSILHEILKENLKNKNYPSNKLSSVIDLEIFKNENITIMGHCFMPLPNRNTEISHHSIHHHGNLILSTVSAFGKGYKSILFDKNFTKNADNSINLKKLKIYVNELNNYEFIDSFQPHVVFFPEDLSITYVVWSSENKKNLDKLKSLKFIQKNKDFFKALLIKLRLNRFVNVNMDTEFDFYVSHNKIFNIKERVNFPKARTKENYLQNLFYILQETEFNDFDFLNDFSKNLETAEKALVDLLILKLKNKECIKDDFSMDFNIPKINLQFSEIIESTN
jgi:hypothetical protein